MTPLTLDITPERPADAAAIEALEARAFGPGRFARTAYRLREGRPHRRDLSFVARVSTLVVGSVRLADVRIGSRPALLLGPLTVEPAFRSRGVGRALIEAAVAAAREAGASLILLVGDQPYYGRLGFVPVPPGQLLLPGPVDPGRLLALPLVPDALEAMRGPVRPGS